MCKELRQIVEKKIHKIPGDGDVACIFRRDLKGVSTNRDFRALLGSQLDAAKQRVLEATMKRFDICTPWVC